MCYGMGCIYEDYMGECTLTHKAGTYGVPDDAECIKDNGEEE